MGNQDKKLHPAVNDEEAEEKLSQGGGIGVYYLAKFRGLHNHSLEPCLFDDTQDNSWHNEPSRLRKEG